MNVFQFTRFVTSLSFPPKNPHWDWSESLSVGRILYNVMVRN